MSRESITTGPTAGSSRRAATHYGRRLEEGKHNAAYHVQGNQWALETTFRFDQLLEATLDELHQRIPANARVLGATLKVIEDFTATSATSIQVGLSQPDGTVIDADGLIVATALPSAGDVIDGSGALVLASTLLGVDAQITVTPDADDLLTGEATIVVVFEKQDDKQQAMNG